MKTQYTVALSMIAGIAIGAAAIQGLHAAPSPASKYAPCRSSQAFLALRTQLKREWSPWPIEWRVRPESLLTTPHA
jgi:hypothetical protein